jgi:hypothetical protein
LSDQPKRNALPAWAHPAAFCAGLAGAVLLVWRIKGGIAGVDPRSVYEVCGGLIVLAAGLGAGSGLAAPPPLDGIWLSRWRVLRAASLTLIVFILMTSLVTILAADRPAGTSVLSDAIALGFVGAGSGLVGYAELAQRYRDDPARLFAAAPTTIYVCVNLAAGIGAFALVRAFGVFDHSKPHATIYEVLLAGFGAIAFFRSSLFTARVGDANVDIGPSTLLKSLLEASDRMINRSQASDRADDATTIMAGVKFMKARAALPTLCFTIVENVTDEDQKRIAAQINALIPGAELTEEQCSVILGVYLIRVVGPAVLARAKNALGTTIT